MTTPAAIKIVLWVHTLPSETAASAMVPACPTMRVSTTPRNIIPTCDAMSGKASRMRMPSSLRKTGFPSPPGLM